MEQTNTTPSKTIPRWNLNTIYPDLHSPEYTEALADYTKKMDEVDALFASAESIKKAGATNFDFPLWLSTYLRISNKLGALETSLFAYSYVIYSTDTTNKEYLDNISKLDEMRLRSQQQTLTFRRFLKQNVASLKDFYTRFPEYNQYSFVIQEEVDQTNHQMTSVEENLADDLQRTGGDAWERLHEQIISNTKDPETGKTFNELRNDAYSGDPQVRISSWKKEIKLLEQNRIALAASLNNIKGATVTLNKRRHWNEAIDRALASSRMQRKTLEALITSIEKSLPRWRDYFQAKALLLRKEGTTADSESDKENPGISFYDLFAPLTGKETKENSPTNRIWTFAETRDYIIEKFSSFSPKMGAFAKKAFDSGWIDAEVRPGKVGGAYCEDFPAQGESRVLSNFTGAF